jgi:3-dehydroquinate synthase
MKGIVHVIAEREYDVTVDCDWRNEFRELVAGRSRVGIVVSAAFRSHIGDLPKVDAEVHLLEIADGENGKNFATLASLWNSLGAKGFTRSDLLVAIGGGATTDIAGFAAATWLRGIDWVAIPTTLVGMVDAAVGGKTGMNSDYGKNLIGAFHSPESVIIDMSWLATLSDRDFSAGLAEVAKCGFIVDEKILTLLTNKTISDLRNSRDLVVELITRSIQVKATVVSTDFKESFAREVLNYGHTLGHAIELHSKFSLRHGEAVAIGMVYAAELAHHKGILSLQLLTKHRELLTSLGLPIGYRADAWPDLLPLISLDKKARGSTVRFVAISEVGETLRLGGLTQAELARAYERISS